MINRNKFDKHTNLIAHALEKITINMEYYLITSHISSMINIPSHVMLPTISFFNPSHSYHLARSKPHNTSFTSMETAKDSALQDEGLLCERM